MSAEIAQGRTRSADSRAERFHRCDRPMPPLTLTNFAPELDALALDEATPTRVEVLTDIAFVVGLVGAVIGIYLIAPDTPVDPLLVLLSIAMISLAHVARIDLPLAWTSPVQLALVPVLFILPPWLVPVAMAASIVLARVPDVLRGRMVAARLLLAPANAWFTVGPAAVLAVAGAPSAADAGALLLLAMLGAQIGTDFAVSVLWQRLTCRVPLADQLKESYMVYAIDAMLFPVGLLAAFAIDESPYSVVLMTPLFGVLAVFAGERRVRLQQLTELNGAYRGTAMVLAEVVDADDAYTGMHTRDVVDLSLEVADRMGLGAEARRKVEFGALLHDVGKVAIPNEIINKPGPLDDREWAVMRTHTVEGQRMLDRVGGAMCEIGKIVRASHERWEGGGYPDGVAGAEIPLEARIICACDAYNAMTTTRSYRNAIPAAAAAAELVRCAGTQFDPVVVEALLSVIGVEPSEEPLAA
jgi:HD-GYP domain-containing protein (c-di-GMP phosphodiesterase class II)